MGKRRLAWSATVGKRPHRITVLQRREGGVIQANYYDPARGRTVQATLGHRDRERAERWARKEADLLALGLTMQVRPEALTVGALLSLYLAHRTPNKVTTEQKADERRAEMWTYLHGTKPVRIMARAEWETFIRERMSGELNPHGVWIGEAKRRPVRARTVDADLVFLDSVFNWACSWNVQGRPLLDANPWGNARPGVRRALQRPRERAPRRPIVTHDWCAAVRKVAPRVTCRVGKETHATPLPVLLDLLEHTGRRISAICRLWYSDLVWGVIQVPQRRQAITGIRWRPFKGEDESIVPLNTEARIAIEHWVRKNPGFGDQPLFPAPKNPAKAITRWTVREWMLAAIALAEVEHPLGGLFHPVRRKWHTERKHHPAVDVMRASGRKDRRAMELSYIQHDDETVLAVVNEPRRLVVRQGA